MDGGLAFYLLVLVAVVLGWFLPHSSSREEEGGEGGEGGEGEPVEPVTELQVQYLRSLIPRHPKFSISIKASMDGVDVRGDITKLEAMAMIDQLKEEESW